MKLHDAVKAAQSRGAVIIRTQGGMRMPLDTWAHCTGEWPDIDWTFTPLANGGLDPEIGLLTANGHTSMTVYRA